ncbi:8848_t:CDS:10 [Diversispora eburnea]|uniref:8848_t:CDS:1 n=1 Tax=Diversispora eburnea TaxID=1213867 RepID=A0A9N8Z5J3_9GLOM|nr:8848_t:CDS:10 [Diversispora eburnea]
MAENYGGKSTIITDDTFITEFLRLPINSSFNSSSPPWISLDPTYMPKVFRHTTVFAGDDKILVFGDLMNSNNLPFTNGPSRIYQHSAVTLGSQNDENLLFLNYNDTSNTINTINTLSNTSNTSNSSITNIIMLIYGGLKDISTGSNNEYISSELWGFYLNESDDRRWQGFPSLQSSPGSLYHHTANIINETLMILIGGIRGNDEMSKMNKIYVFDFINTEWTIYDAKGQIPTPRRDHSAVAFQTSIIIYGGTDLNATTIYGDVAVLDTITWEWSAFPTINTPPGRYCHTANLIETEFLDTTIDKNIYILNILNWTWLDIYIPTNLPPSHSISASPSNTTNTTITITTTVPSSPDSTSLILERIPRGLIIGLALTSSIIALMLLIMLVWYLDRKRHKNENNENNESNESNGNNENGLLGTVNGIPPSPSSFPCENDDENSFYCRDNRDNRDSNKYNNHRNSIRNSIRNRGGRRGSFPRLSSSSISNIFKLSNNDYNKNEKGEKSNKNDKSNERNSKKNSKRKNQRKQPEFRSSFDSADIIHIARGLEVQRHSICGDSLVVVARNRLRVNFENFRDLEEAYAILMEENNILEELNEYLTQQTDYLSEETSKQQIKIQQLEQINEKSHKTTRKNSDNENNRDLKLSSEDEERLIQLESEMVAMRTQYNSELTSKNEQISQLENQLLEYENYGNEIKELKSKLEFNELKFSSAISSKKTLILEKASLTKEKAELQQKLDNSQKETARHQNKNVQITELETQLRQSQKEKLVFSDRTSQKLKDIQNELQIEKEKSSKLNREKIAALKDKYDIQRRVNILTEFRDTLEVDIHEEKEHVKALETEIQDITDQLQSERRDHQFKSEQLSRYEDELQAVRDQCVKLKEEMDQLQVTLSHERNQFKIQLRSIEANNKRRNMDTKNMHEQKKYIEKCELLVKEVKYLKAKCYRESGFRADLSYQKNFLMLLFGDVETCKQAILNLISDIQGSCCSNPLLIKFRGAVRAIIAIQRMRYLG